ncbi:hypothetical protein KL86PLE_30247 [uncultured Pleomorphomonas sp.]|uniref:Uncharacterized protein n=1 Tax=uncultured Pleomorphomonas sp. TaxID=442121 RepID=A0A212LE74_9HYPH|nr:hypothetical protein KL86PLE_30247 [uncultured Pleomorphomonas sp.]
MPDRIHRRDRRSSVNIRSSLVKHVQRPVGSLRQQIFASFRIEARWNRAGAVVRRARRRRRSEVEAAERRHRQAGVFRLSRTLKTPAINKNGHPGAPKRERRDGRDRRAVRRQAATGVVRRFGR